MSGSPAALEWPAWSKNLSPWARFFIGIPVVGAQSRLRRELCAQLQSRSAASLEEWGGNPGRRELAQAIADILKAHLGWPNAVFLPRDRFEVLCWDHSAYVVDDLRAGSALIAIEKQLTAPLPDEFWPQARSLSFGEVVDRLLQRQDAG